MAAAGFKSNKPTCALYLSAEENAARLIEKTNEYKWNPVPHKREVKNLVFKYDHIFPKAVPPNYVLIKDYLKTQTSDEAATLFQTIAGEWITKVEAFQQIDGERDSLKMLVLDSLNVLTPDARSGERVRVFSALQRSICRPQGKKTNPDLVIIILDGSTDDEHSLYWEYVSDIVIRFNWDRSKGYALRTFEIAKMRDQKHVLGAHRMKIYGEPSRETFPYRTQGGIHIFPSIHWYLSNLKTEAEDRQDSQVLLLPPDVEQLNTQISTDRRFGGFPLPGCTALEGNRGSMKSHIAYLFLLHQARIGRNCLLISLRDDVRSVRTTLRKIAEDQEWKAVDVDKLIERDDRIAVIYNEVGNVSAEEFFQRVFVAIHRRRANRKTAEVVVINELDELSNRFPLIATEVLFVPALIQMLKKNGICVVTASATGDDSAAGGEGLHGLNPMADLLLRFERVSQRKTPARFKAEDLDVPERIRDSKQISRIETVRVTAGQVGGQMGFLYRSTGSRKVQYEWCK